MCVCVCAYVYAHVCVCYVCVSVAWEHRLAAARKEVQKVAMRYLRYNTCHVKSAAEQPTRVHPARAACHTLQGLLGNGRGLFHPQ